MQIQIQEEYGVLAMTDKLDIPKLLELARAAEKSDWFTAEREMGYAFTPAVAISLCERVRTLEEKLHVTES